MKLREAMPWGPECARPHCSQHPRIGTLVPAQTPLDLASFFPFPKMKSLTTNFKCHREAGLTLVGSTKGTPVPGTAREAPLYSGDGHSQRPSLRIMLMCEELLGPLQPKWGRHLPTPPRPGKRTGQRSQVEGPLPLVLRFLHLLQNPDRS